MQRFWMVGGQLGNYFRPTPGVGLAGGGRYGGKKYRFTSIVQSTAGEMRARESCALAGGIRYSLSSSRHPSRSGWLGAWLRRRGAAISLFVWGYGGGRVCGR